MIYSAIRDYFSEQKDERHGDIERTYLTSKILRSKEAEPKLRLNEIDDPFFRKHVLSPPGSPDRVTDPSTDSHRRIAKAFTRIRDEINQVAAAATNDPLDALLARLGRLLAVQGPRNSLALG
jgi:hypothetical protein